MRRLHLTLALTLACLSITFAQQITALRKGSADHAAIVKAVTPFANKNAAGAVRVKGDTVRRFGKWAFIVWTMTFVDPAMQGDGALMSLLTKSGAKWKIKEIVVGSGGMSDMAYGWAKKYRLPKALVKNNY